MASYSDATHILSQNGYMLHQLPRNLRNNRRIVLAAVLQDWYQLWLAPPKLQNDR